MNYLEVGKKLELFFFDESAVGSCFFLPKGTKVYNKLINFMKNQYKKMRYDEIITPMIFSNKLWVESGHWDKYYKNMFHLKSDISDSSESDSSKLSLKPMNCPGHCIMFKHLNITYKDLPLRWADFGVLHRNELSGTLSGLTRLRKFQQDDAHIFCTMDQVESEIEDYLTSVKNIYKIFNFSFDLELSTKPSIFIGSSDNWLNAEKKLWNKISDFPKWKLNEGGGSFYGPKIDITVNDSLGRSHQCGTIQLDFNLPERFDLKYKTSDGLLKRPVLIHRAIFGSVERFMAIILEHTNGKLPFWLSPRQICVIPVSDKYIDYAEHIKKIFIEYEIEISKSKESISKKIVNAYKLKFNYILVVGKREEQGKIVSVRNRKGHSEIKTIEEISQIFRSLCSY